MQNSSTEKAVNMTKILLVRYLKHRRSRLTLIFLSVILSSATIASLINLHLDINSKMSRELRAYGANIVVTKDTSFGELESRSFIRQKELEIVKATFQKEKLVGFSPYLYGVADSGENRFAVLGVVLPEFIKLSPYVNNGKSLALDSPEKALVGKSLALKLGAAVGDRISIRPISAKSKETYFAIAGVIETGDDVDERLVIDIKAAQSLFDAQDKADAIYASYLGTVKDVEHLDKEIRARVPEIAVHSISKISKSEASIMRKISSLNFFASVAILLGATLAVAIILSSLVFERRYEIGVKKALGASNKDVISELLIEGVFVGITGGIAGWLAGAVVAQLIGLSLFDSTISVRIWTSAITIGVAVVMGAFATAFPAKYIAEIEPANVLRNE